MLVPLLKKKKLILPWSTCSKTLFLFYFATKTLKSIAIFTRLFPDDDHKCSVNYCHLGTCLDQNRMREVKKFNKLGERVEINAFVSSSREPSKNPVLQSQMLLCICPEGFRGNDCSLGEF